MKVYLDNAATTPVAPEVVEAIMPYFSERFGNPSSVHQFGRESKAAIEMARKKVASYFNTSPSEIFFTSGGTESANLVIQGAVQSLEIKTIITSKIEHHCVLHPVEELEKQQGINVNYVDLDNDGNVNLGHLAILLKECKEKALVCLMHANNEIGNVLDIERVGELCSEHEAYFFSDTVQTIAHYPIDLQKYKVDFISGSAHKFHGPKGVGFVYIKSDASIKPMFFGGAQERNMRAGTENLAGIIGLEKALELGYDNLEEDHKYIQDLKSYFLQQISNEIPDIRVNGNKENDSLYTVLNLSFPANDRSELLVFNLDINQIAASAGSACSSGSDVGSHVLKELDLDLSRSNVRFSFSRYTTKEELDYTIEKMKELYLVRV